VAESLRDLAERLEILQDCDCRSGCERCVLPAPGGHSYALHRLPTEAEVREAIFEAGVTWIEVGSSRAFAYVMFGGDEEYRAEAWPEDAEPELVLLALLRALEVARRG
jgi:hypothetical protein